MLIETLYEMFKEDYSGSFKRLTDALESWGCDFEFYYLGDYFQTEIIYPNGAQRALKPVRFHHNVGTEQHESEIKSVIAAWETQIEV